jgi:hypothetical protein
MFSGEGVPADWAAETVDLVTSALMMAGIAFIAPIILQSVKTDKFLKLVR